MFTRTATRARVAASAAALVAMFTLTACGGGSELDGEYIYADGGHIDTATFDDSDVTITEINCSPGRKAVGERVWEGTLDETGTSATGNPVKPEIGDVETISVQRTKDAAKIDGDQYLRKGSPAADAAVEKSKQSCARNGWSYDL